MTSEVFYNGDLRTTLTHLRSGSEVVTDAPVDNQGKGAAFSPTDLVATALASCMITTMGIKARDKNINMDGAKATVNKIMAANPRRISRVEITIAMPAGVYSESDKNLLEATARGCPVSRTLAPECEQVVTFIW